MLWTLVSCELLLPNPTSSFHPKSKWYMQGNLVIPRTRTTKKLLDNNKGKTTWTLFSLMKENMPIYFRTNDHVLMKENMPIYFSINDFSIVLGRKPIIKSLAYCLDSTNYACISNLHSSNMVEFPITLAIMRASCTRGFDVLFFGINIFLHNVFFQSMSWHAWPMKHGIYKEKVTFISIFHLSHLLFHL